MAREPNLPSGYVTSVYFESSASLFPSHPQINTGAALKTSLRPNPSALHERCAKPFVCMFLRMPSKRKESGYPVQLHSLQEQPHPRVQKSFTTKNYQNAYKNFIQKIFRLKLSKDLIFQVGNR